MLAYLADDRVKREYNRERKNCWEVYLEEMFDTMGARGGKLAVSDVAGSLAHLRVLVLGAQSSPHLDAVLRERIAQWVRRGGILIGFAVEGLDDVFGIGHAGDPVRQADEYGCSGTFELRPHALTNGVHHPLFMEQKLPVFSDIRRVAARQCVELARLYDHDDNDARHPAITVHEYGAGKAAYFAFDAAKTVWILHQGRPLPLGPASEHLSKTSQLQVIGRHSRKVPYADEVVFLLQNMIALGRLPFIHPVPPDGEQVTDALLCWSGDEYFGPADISLAASDWFRDQGLPYHINIGVEQTQGEQDGHPMTPEQFRRIADNGHEISLYYCFPCENKDAYAITADSIRYQTDLFAERYGYRPGSTLLNSCNWQGWAEPAKWLAAAGSKADNTFFVHGVAGDHPNYNCPGYGFGSGTGFPFHFYDDWSGGNERIPLLEQPIVCYEIGHRGLSGGQDPNIFVPEEIHLAVDVALRYHMVMNVFYHPVSIVKWPRSKEAIAEMLRYIRYRGARVVHMGNDRAHAWWTARTETDAAETAITGNRFSCTVRTGYEAGVIVKWRLREGDAVETVAAGGRPAPFQIRRAAGGLWLYAIVPPGTCALEIVLKEDIL